MTDPTFTYLRTTRLRVPGADPGAAVEDVALYRNRETGKVHVVRQDEDRHQVTSVMPRDRPSSGTWVGPPSDFGIAYVSDGHSLGYIRQLEREAAPTPEVAGIDL